LDLEGEIRELGCREDGRVEAEVGATAVALSKDCTPCVTSVNACTMPVSRMCTPATTVSVGGPPNTTVDGAGGVGGALLPEAQGP